MELFKHLFVSVKLFRLEKLSMLSLLSITSVLVAACSSSTNDTSASSHHIVTAQSTMTDSSSSIIIPAESSATNLKTNQEIDILIPRSYRVFEGNNHTEVLNAQWFDIYREDGHVFIAPVVYRIENGYDQCSGDSLRIIESARESILFLNKPDSKQGKLETVENLKDSILSPLKTVAFSFNKVQYVLESTGEGKDFNIKNYNLTLSANGNHQYLIKAEDLNDTQIELVFAGDIDGDGKLDLILAAPLDYEQDRYLLFLSSKAEEGHIVYLAGELAVQFDC